MKKPVLFEEHKKLGAKMTSFAGWRLPLEFSNAKKEHLYVRQAVGIFDVSHMGQIRIKGKGALDFLSLLVTSPAEKLKEKQCQYGLLCNRQGGIIDDLIIYCIEHSKNYLLCVNAGNIEKDFEWIKKQQALHSFTAHASDESFLWGQIAVQGPKAMPLMKDIFGPIDMKKFNFDFFNFKDNSLLISRTGYTGEDGFEILSPPKAMKDIWKTLLSNKAQPSGLAARDTLRLEMKYPLYGKDMDETTTPVEMGLMWACQNTHNFIGKDSLKNSTLKWIGFEMLKTEGVPRSGCAVYSENGENIGQVTSGAFSPSLNKMIGLARIASSHCALGNLLLVEIHSQKKEARVVQTPFK